MQNLGAQSCCQALQPTNANIGSIGEVLLELEKRIHSQRHMLTSIQSVLIFNENSNVALEPAEPINLTLAEKLRLLAEKLMINERYIEEIGGILEANFGKEIKLG